jgi:hypothetical protein
MSRPISLLKNFTCRPMSNPKQSTVPVIEGTNTQLRKRKSSTTPTDLNTKHTDNIGCFREVKNIEESKTGSKRKATRSIEDMKQQIIFLESKGKKLRERSEKIMNEARNLRDIINESETTEEKAKNSEYIINFLTPYSMDGIQRIFDMNQKAIIPGLCTYETGGERYIKLYNKEVLIGTCTGRENHTGEWSWINEIIYEEKCKDVKLTEWLKIQGFPCHEKDLESYIVDDSVVELIQYWLNSSGNSIQFCVEIESSILNEKILFQNVNQRSRGGKLRTMGFITMTFEKLCGQDIRVYAATVSKK